MSNDDLLYPQLEGHTVDARKLADLLFRLHRHLELWDFDGGGQERNRKTAAYKMVEAERGSTLTFVSSHAVFDWIEEQTGIKSG